MSTYTLKLPRVDDLGPTIANARTLVTVIDAVLPAVLVNFSVPPDGLPADELPQPVEYVIRLELSW